MEQCAPHQMKPPLYDIHQALGAKCIPFAGWEMPLHYRSGTLYEHHAVRNGVGLFDVSHMGRITVAGPAAATVVDQLCTHNVTSPPDGSATYSVLARDDGSSVDDTLVYKVNATTFFFVVNAANRDKTLAHIEAHAGDATVTDHYSDEGILALQGPAALALVTSLFPKVTALAPSRFTRCHYQGMPCIISRTGYTGAGGVEIYCPTSTLAPLWEQFVTSGAEPVGLAARDTLRLEMGYALYGHELSDTIAPTESVAAWAVNFNKPHFIGKEALLALEVSGNKRQQYGAIVDGKGIPRAGNSTTGDGVVTSGGYSPTLNQSIAIVMSRQSPAVGDTITIDIRGVSVSAHIAALPFIRPKRKP